MSFFSERLKTGSKKRFIVPDTPLPSSYIPRYDLPIQLIDKPSYGVYTLSASDPQTDVELHIAEPIIVYVGCVNINTLTGQTYNIETITSPIKVKIGDVSNPPLNLYVGESIELPTFNNKLYISSAPTGLAQYLLFYGFPRGYKFKNHKLSPFYSEDGFGKYEDRAKVTNGNINTVLQTGDNLVGKVKITDDGTDITNVEGTSGSTFANTILGLHTISAGYGWDGTNWRKISINTLGQQLVSVVNSPIGVSILEDTAIVEYSFQATAATGVAVTVTLVPNADYININWIDIYLYNTAARTGGATPVSVTISGFRDNNAVAKTFSYPFPTAGAIGTVVPIHIDGAKIFKGIFQTNVVITCPATTGVIWRVNGTFRDI